MVLSSQNKKHEQLRCQIRGDWVAATPEELVRQKLIGHLVEGLGFPKSIVSIEKALSTAEAPERRTDIVCYTKHEDQLIPLLLIECKATPLNDRVFNQAVGYNHYLRASYIAIANEQELLMGWYDKEKEGYTYIPYIPSYEQLVDSF